MAPINTTASSGPTSKLSKVADKSKLKKTSKPPGNEPAKIAKSKNPQPGPSSAISRNTTLNHYNPYLPQPKVSRSALKVGGESKLKKTSGPPPNQPKPNSLQPGGQSSTFSKNSTQNHTPIPPPPQPKVSSSTLKVDGESELKETSESLAIQQTVDKPKIPQPGPSSAISIIPTPPPPPAPKLSSSTLKTVMKIINNATDKIAALAQKDKATSCDMSVTVGGLVAITIIELAVAASASERHFEVGQAMSGILEGGIAKISGVAGRGLTEHASFALAGIMNMTAMAISSVATGAAAASEGKVEKKGSEDKGSLSLPAPTSAKGKSDSELKTSKPINSFANVYEFRITLLDSKPLVWRMILVAEDFTFRSLHFIIKSIMGFPGLEHHFKIETDDNGGRSGRKPGKLLPVDETEAKISDYFGLNFEKRNGYYFNLQSNQKVAIVLEAIRSRREGVEYPICIGADNGMKFEEMETESG